jgi:hypothetical protein
MLQLSIPQPTKSSADIDWVMPIVERNNNLSALGPRATLKQADDFVLNKPSPLHVHMIIAFALGVGFAIAKTAAAIGMGLFGGYGTMLLTRSGLLSTGDELRITVERKSCCKSAKQDAAVKPVWRFWEEGERAQVFLTASATTAWFLTGGSHSPSPSRAS